ncbi:hypothetical protein ACH0BF_09025 [Pseudobacillus sp. 179-B 2D1 NHS]|uniref:hypothetical protein n=1 Tax=Pseudobacillus sp. 179-B 2D1 NHS TaxID=3374292 RepID=UPI00387A58A4
MGYLYDGHTVMKILSGKGVSQRVERLKKKSSCPYDGIVFCSRNLPNDSFLQLIKPARRGGHPVISNKYFHYELRCSLFHLFWLPYCKSEWSTHIRINPNKKRLTPKGVLEILLLVFGDLDGIHVHSFDEKVDLKNQTVRGIVKKLFVPYVRSLKDFEYKQETYYYGERSGQQTKVYDKGKEQGTKEGELTRVEKRKKYSGDQRPTLKEFLFSPESKALSSLVLVDVDKIDKRKRLGKFIKQHLTIQEAYRSMDDAMRKQFKRHEGYTNPLIDLGKVFTDDAVAWIRISFSDKNEIEQGLLDYNSREETAV